MKHIDLFSGIGGFALAVDTVWPGSEHIFCDNDKFCQQVLKKHWPKSKIYGDIRTIANAHGHGLQEPGAEQQTDRNRQFSKNTHKKPNITYDILTGGFPCQPFSAAGLRKGTDDNRYLWPEMFKVIRTFKPTWVIAENVRGLVTWDDGMVFEQVCADLEGQGYEVQAFIIPALAVNAPHRRDRIWFIAHSDSDEYGRGGQGQVRKTEKIPRGNWQALRSGRTRGTTENIAKNARDAERRGQPRDTRRRPGQKPTDGFTWDTPWLEVATKFCRVDNGLSVELDGLKLTKAGHRTERLKALGNSIVPQIAIEIFKTIRQIG